MGRTGFRRQQLGEAIVAQAVHTHVSVAPGLGGDPLHGVVAVPLLAGAVKVHLPLGVAGAPQVLQQHPVPRPGQGQGIQLSPEEFEGVLQIGEPQQDHRPGGGFLRLKQVPPEDHPVPHGNFQVVANPDGLFFAHTITPCVQMAADAC